MRPRGVGLWLLACFLVAFIMSFYWYVGTQRVWLDLADDAVAYALQQER